MCSLTASVPKGERTSAHASGIRSEYVFLSSSSAALRIFCFSSRLEIATNVQGCK